MTNVRRCPGLYVMLTAVIMTALFTISTHVRTAHGQAEEQASSPEIIFILDASGSMWGRIEGQNKIAIAKKVLVDLIGEMPDGANVGLIAYGHRDKGDCKDIETIVPPGPLNKKLMSEKIGAVSPKGKTPITDSVAQAFDILRGRENAATVILLTDGLETCGGDPCRAVKDAKAAGIDFVMHVVGFDVAKQDVSQLECAAQAGGGLYLGAENADELSSALDTAVELPAESHSGKLSVEVTAEGELRDSTVTVINPETGEIMASGRTYKSGDTNPRVMPLPDGTYDVEIAPLGIKGAAKRTIRGIVIENGQSVEKAVDFSFGELSVRVTRNGALSDATVSVYETGTKNFVSGGRSYTKPESNPEKISLSPGVYDLSVGSVEIDDKPVLVFEKIEIKAGETTEKTAGFSSGTLKVGAVNENDPVDATVSIKKADSGESVAGGRIYSNTQSNPKEFVLTPGSYVVSVRAIKMADRPDENYDIQIVEGKEVVIEADFTDE